VGGRAGSLDRTEAVGGQRRVNAVPIRANLSSVGIIAMPESAIEESNIDVLYREAISAVWDAAGAGTHFGVCSGRSRTRAGRTVGGSSAAGCWHSRACGLPRLVSGSVSRYCLSHAKCTTVIVPVDNRAVSTGNSSNRPQGCETEMLPISRRTPQAWGHNETRKPSCD